MKKKGTVWTSKVRTFWEALKIWKNLPHTLYIYLVNVQSMRKIFSNFVCFSKSPNFKKPLNLIKINIFELKQLLSSIQIGLQYQLEIEMMNEFWIG